jgi:hypothetical protein
MKRIDAALGVRRGAHSRAKARLLLLLFVAALLPAVVLVERELADRHPIRISRIVRTPIADGVEMIEGELQRGDDDGGRLVALYFDPQETKPMLLLNDKQASLADLAPEALVVINAGFFTKERRPTGLLVSEGHVLSPFVAQAGGAGSGVFLVEGGHAHLIERDKLSRKSYDHVELGIQAGPRIIEPTGGYGILSDDGARANRTVIGVNEEGRMIIAVVLGPSGWPTGPTLFELQHLLGPGGLGLHASQLAFRMALNLDGGPSTGLHVRAAAHRFDAPESAPVHSVLALRTHE